ncbi:MAG: hypothetical protein AAGJ10_02110 [Bacteroidota bacterium]
MALYQLQSATLGNIEGEGFAFRKRTVNSRIRGVFFATEDVQDKLQALVEEDEVHFSGVTYRKLRSGKIKKRVADFVVNVKGFLSVRAGERVTFEVIEEVE